MRNRTADLLLTMETLCLLSYRGRAGSASRVGTDPQRYTLARGRGESETDRSRRQMQVEHPAAAKACAAAIRALSSLRPEEREAAKARAGPGWSGPETG